MLQVILPNFLISIHALRGEGDRIRSYIRCLYCISIHALRGEGDGENGEAEKDADKFQSTPSVGRATVNLK